MPRQANKVNEETDQVGANKVDEALDNLEEQKPEAKKPVKSKPKSKVGRMYIKWQLLERSVDADQITMFDKNGEKKKLCEITMPDKAVKILNGQTKYSGIYFEEK